MALQILLAEHPVLRKVALPLSAEEIPKHTGLAQKMLRTCLAAKAAGLAAPQVGISKRLVVTHVGFPLVWVNPVVVPVASPIVVGPEGCLSIPKKIVQVPRARVILVEYMDLSGTPHTEWVEGPLAIVLQHEVDHLNGILITDYEKANDSTTES